MIGIQGVPDTGCNVFNGTYFDNYTSNIRSRYYIYDGQAVLSSTSTYNTIPAGAVCADLSTIAYDPFSQSLLIIGVVVGVIAVLLSAYSVVIKPFIKVKRG